MGNLQGDIGNALNKYGRRVQCLEVVSAYDGDEVVVEAVLAVRLCGHEADGRSLAKELRKFSARLEAESCPPSVSYDAALLAENERLLRAVEEMSAEMDRLRQLLAKF